MRQYAGFATAEETNARFRYLLAAGAPGLSTAFDLPTQLGMDSDDPLAAGEVGRVGVAIDSVEDMARLFDGIPLDRVSTSMTINAPAAVLLLLYQLVAEEGGADPRELRGTVQNDVLKEYVARGNYIFPPGPSMRLTTDTFAYCDAELPRWNTISISGYHIREAGSTAVQEVAFTLANGIAYVEAALAAGLEVDRFGPRLSFFFNAHNDLLQEVAKFRAARSLWAHIMRDRFGATDAALDDAALPRPDRRQHPDRPAAARERGARGRAGAVGGPGRAPSRSTPTSSTRRSPCRPRRAPSSPCAPSRSSRPRPGITGTVDPLGGSYAIEVLTAELEERARELIEEIDRRGGATECIEYMREAIADAAFRHHEEVLSGAREVIGVNVQREEDETPIEIHRIDPRIEADQVARVRAAPRGARRGGGRGAAGRACATPRAAAGNLLPPMREALRARATVGEVCGVLREEFGEYDRVRAYR